MDNNLQQLTKNSISFFKDTIKSTPLENEYNSWLDKKAEELNQPCTLAVSGQVSAGKSTFVNALIGEELAKTGIEEVTATLTYFKHGVYNKEKPVTCYWENGNITKHPIKFLSELQGYEECVLKKIKNISHFEVFLETVPPGITIIDTPGTDAVVKQHESETQKVISLKNNAKTEKLTKDATAVIYLIGTPVANIQHQQFLSNFREATGENSNPMNAVGVLSMIDKQKEILFNADDLANDIAAKMKKELNTVVPISAAIYAALEDLKENKKLKRFFEMVNTIPKNVLDELLEDKEFFDEDIHEECPTIANELVEHRNYIPWTVFKLIVQTFKGNSFDSATSKLYTLSGFHNLKKTLQQHFFKRAQLLTCYKVTNDLKKAIDQIEINDFPIIRHSLKENKKLKAQYIKYIEVAKAFQTPEVGDSIIQFINTNLHVDDSDSLKNRIQAIKQNIESTLEKLQIYNDDFYALNLLENSDLELSESEKTELKYLFGMYGGELKNRVGNLDELAVDFIGKRQAEWVCRGNESIDTAEKSICKLAEERYGNILYNLIN